MGFTLPFSPGTQAQAIAWARVAWEKLRKCHECGAPLPDCKPALDTAAPTATLDAQARVDVELEKLLELLRSRGQRGVTSREIREIT